MGARIGETSNHYVLAKQLMLLSGSSKSRAAPQWKRSKGYCQPVPNPTASKENKQDRPKIIARFNKKSRSYGNSMAMRQV